MTPEQVFDHVRELARKLQGSRFDTEEKQGRANSAMQRLLEVHKQGKMHERDLLILLLRTVHNTSLRAIGKYLGLSYEMIRLVEKEAKENARIHLQSEKP